MFPILSGLVCGLALTQSVHAVDIDQEANEGIPATGLDTTNWTTGVLPDLAEMFTLNDFQIAAKNVLSPRDYTQYRTGTLDETTYKNNLNVYSKILFNTLIFQDVSKINLNTTILGYNFSAPYFIAPAANLNVSNSGTEDNLVRAAASAGILYIPSIGAKMKIEDIAAAGADGQVMFHHEYIWANTTQLQNELRRIEAAGFKAIFLAIDNTGTGGIRDRAQRFTLGGDSGHSLSFTVEALDQLRNWTSLPIVPKGVKSARDVKLCADLGFDAVYISNHGGRVVDGTPTAIEVLLDLHANYPEVFDQIEIYADGGVRRGTHVLALLALGVRAVGLGRPPVFSNIFGQEGVEKMLHILRTELVTEMQLLGLTDVDQWRGNTSLINTRKVELEYFGAPVSSFGF
ncbi:FMN-dependent alpha-hydroxy acid dehydrogenase [Truncatella angustata]|uniref:FMN-dependent alpha-hydroxy acid dehydrogenase n=1 Tax=Truncatella angustata TaxID=152316 RepID=A0A9P8RGC1_9PEZI|nr:FMN-dependent alpha-hydroxy acid dehydrogenase [Truncatella angustata]KAH6645342.1 FMN-dependent alpha-hydroxy acid dehydrogenase [Truncatella angustata]